MSLRRIAVGIAAAAVTAVLAQAVLAIVWTGIEQRDLSAGVAGGGWYLMGFTLVGLPIAVVAAALGAVLCYPLFRRLGWLRPGPIALAGAIIGTVTLQVTLSGVEPAGWHWGNVLPGAVSGAAAGFAFAVISLPRGAPVAA
jgi:hypothetical protein